MANKHTTEPWIIEPHDCRCGPELNITGTSNDPTQPKIYVAVVKATRNDCLTSTHGGWYSPPADEALYNAVLIKNAPDMLKALESVEMFLDGEYRRRLAASRDGYYVQEVAVRLLEVQMAIRIAKGGTRG